MNSSKVSYLKAMDPLSSRLPAPWDYIFSIVTRLLVWGLMFALLYILRSFFLLVFLTFVFAYIQNSGVEKLRKRIPHRSTCVVLVAGLLLGVLLTVGIFLVPKVKGQAALVVENYPRYIATLDTEIMNTIKRYPALDELYDQLSHSQERPEREGGAAKKISESPSRALISPMLGLQKESSSEYMRDWLDIVANLGGALLSIGSAFLLSLLFSFLIVLDLPALERGVKNLKNTRVGFVYDEVSSNFYNFGRAMGRAFEAQFFIALLNTVLTAFGILLIGLGDKVAFLSVVVFICSFIPVMGVFVSSAPIALLALQEQGISMMFASIVLIIVIHLIETYILNPRIYGHHMRMNPVIVLIILTVGGKLFHVWGLILGVPLCTYLFGYAIRYKNTEQNSY